MSKSSEDAAAEELDILNAFLDSEAHTFLRAQLTGNLKSEYENSIDIAKISTAYRPPQVLYRYRSFANPEYRSTELLRTFGHCHVFAADPSKFNDYYDCSPTIVGNTQAEAAFFVNTYLREDLFSTDFITLMKRIDDSAEGLNEDELRKFLLDAALEVMDSMYSVIRCACFSTRCDSASMWYHYANMYKGLCFKYELPDDVDENTLKLYFDHPRNRMLAVTYTPERPIVSSLSIIKVKMSDFDVHFRLLVQSDIKKLVHLSYFTKSSDWSYEEEVRITSTLGNPYISIDPYKLTQVILGPNVDRDLEDQVRRLSEVWGISVVSAGKSATRFGIRVDEQA